MSENQEEEQEEELTTSEVEGYRLYGTIIDTETGDPIEDVDVAAWQEED